MKEEQKPLLLYALLRLHIVKGKVIIFVNSLELWGRGARVRRRPNAKPSKPGRRWTKEEDALLLEAVKQVPDHNWVEVAKRRRAGGE